MHIGTVMQASQPLFYFYVSFDRSVWIVVIFLCIVSSYICAFDSNSCSQ